MNKSVSFICVFSVFFFLNFCLRNFTFAQEDWKLSELTSDVGEGAFTSGFDVEIKFSKKNNTLNIRGNHERVYFIYNWSLPLKTTFGASGGFFKNMFWVGPRVIIAPNKFLSFLHWCGWCAGEPNKPDTRIQDMFFTNGFYLTIEKIKFGFIWTRFMEEKTFIPGVTYTHSLNKKFKTFVGVDYKKSESIPLYHIGVSYFPNK